MDGPDWARLPADTPGAARLQERVARKPTTVPEASLGIGNRGHARTGARRRRQKQMHATVACRREACSAGGSPLSLATVIYPLEKSGRPCVGCVRGLDGRSNSA
jgi:hypothetical protein